MKDNFDYGFVLRKIILLAFISLFYWVVLGLWVGLPVALMGGRIGFFVVMAVVLLLIVPWVLYRHGDILDKKE